MVATGAGVSDGNMSLADEEQRSARDHSNLRRDGSLKKTGPDSLFRLVTRLWCKDTEGQVLALHEADVVFIAYEVIKWYLFLGRCALLKILDPIMLRV